MNASREFKPNWASVPGETIVDFINEKGSTIDHFARKMKMPTALLQNLIDGRVQIDEKIATTLNSVIGGSVDFWIARQAQFNNDSIRIKTEQDQVWVKHFPLRDMIRFGWVKDSGNKLSECLNFFDVPDIHTWESKYGSLLASTTFRKSTTFVSQLYATAAWLRYGEIKGNAIECKSWDVKIFEKTLFEIKSLTRKKDPKDFLPTLVEECSKCGVAVVIAPSPTGCRASGATKFLSQTKAMILLSFRYLSDDQFWFTFFHEAGHLLLHNHSTIFLEGIQEEQMSDLEAEANAFAGDHLIPHQLQNELLKLKGNTKDIIRFALKAGVSPGIVVGQMQHYNYISKGYLNSFKRRYNWSDIPFN